MKQLCKRYGISKRTVNRWLIKFVGSNKTKKTGRLSDLINDLERENKQLKNKVAELWIDYNSLRSALVKPGREC
jgi:predicted ribosome quality control (RQC) complex YloA/Tae2 family protein